MQPSCGPGRSIQAPSTPSFPGALEHPHPSQGGDPSLRSLPWARVAGSRPCERMSFGLARLRDPAESRGCLRKQPDAVSASFAGIHSRTESPAFCVLGQGKNSHLYSPFWTWEEEEYLSLLFLCPGVWAGSEQRLIYPPTAQLLGQTALQTSVF